MQRRRARWVGGLGVVALIGAMLIVGAGPGSTLADDDKGKNPFTQILKKLDDILAKLNGGGGQDGNHTLRWDTNNPSASRFVTAFPGAVLDKNTGLVWEQAPDVNGQIWDFAIRTCVNKTVGGTVGWRLPSVVELKSIQDPTLPAPFVPANVFASIQPTSYWSISSPPAAPVFAWVVRFNDGVVGVDGKNGNLFVWCVRGPMQESVY